MSKFSLSFLFCLACSISASFAQKIPANLEKEADSLYYTKQYQESAGKYVQVAEQADFKIKTAHCYYQAACCYGLMKQNDAAYNYLSKAIEAGFGDKKHILKDSDLDVLHGEKRWTKLLAGMKEETKVLNTDPRKPKLITTDVANFWIAYDKALVDTANFRALIKEYYFDKASAGMQDYMGIKVASIDAFVKFLKATPKLHEAIRYNSLAGDRMKEETYTSFARFKEIYPAALYPDVYFVIGAFTSGGTVSDKGLLIGINQFCDDPTVPKDELTEQLKTRFVKKDYIVGLVPHELIHFQQNNLKRDTTTLAGAITEGMADFIGEQICGINANEVLYQWAKGKEKAIWKRFLPDMNLKRYKSWLANSQTSTPDSPPDQGYWIGYQICKAYYEQAPDKKKAIDDMLHIQDYPKFLKDSKWEEKVAKM